MRFFAIKKNTLLSFGAFIIFIFIFGNKVLEYRLKYGIVYIRRKNMTYKEFMEEKKVNDELVKKDKSTDLENLEQFADFIKKNNCKRKGD